MTRPQAAILLVGDELLDGKVEDRNAGFLARKLFDRGVRVRRIVVVPDQVPEIAETLRDLRRLADFVITSGGIGPTLDDVTVEAVALALERPLERHPDLVSRARDLFGPELTEAHLKMADVPRGAMLVDAPKMRWPVLVVDDVYVLAGIPEILRRSYEAIAPLLPSREALSRAAVIVGVDEWTLAPTLESVARDHPSVQVGSYPVLEQGHSFYVKLVLQSPDRSALELALDELLSDIPEEKLYEVERPE